MIWLENTLEKYKNSKYKWFFGHVPPRNITSWWPNEITKEDKNIKMAKLLEKYRITAAFFEQEHDEYFLGDRGGFPMFETGMHYPLLVEVFDDEIKYSYLVDHLNNLEKTIDPFKLPFIDSWKITIIKKDEKLPENIQNILPEENENLKFKKINSNKNGEVNLKEFEDLNIGDKIIAIGEFKSKYYKGCHLMIKSKMPFSIWINGILLEEKGEDDNRYHFYSSYSVKAKEDKNIVLVLLEVKDKSNLSFSVYIDFSINVIKRFIFENH